ncbi:hypothetical protein PC128_g7355 [Phytophthora cactorum]|nr:hypothetical protein PC120_g18867 [Phytophthora cactorum]KAG3057762.1 hypothetical protein PC121_g14701 [Phytophthora cactorum]KAG3196784.1 hypothetical protein PC128_g7355 [Phytophthora cactorum]KAG4045181.1 hypothetical protein PC123_g19404 [Phytophthora cactorum]
MAPGRAWRKENDVSNRRVSVTSSEDVAVPSANVPFEELLARELRKSGGTDAKKSAPASGKVAKKPFLKRGARGWWMRQPGAKQKVVKHTLVSKREEAASRAAPVVQRRQHKQQQRRRRSSSASSSKTLSPVATPREQIRTAPVPPQTRSPPVSPIRRTQYSNQVDNDADEVLQRGQQNEEFNTWKNASFRSTTSTDMGLINVRKSYEAKQEREANEMAEFEAIERDLAAEKEAHLKEKQQQSSAQVDRQDQVHENQTDHQGLPYSSFVSELHDQEQSRWQTAGSGSIFDDSLDEGADSELVFDDHSALSKDDWVAGDNGFTNQLRSHFGYGGNDYGNAISDLSAVSFDDSVPWDDGLSFQPRQSLEHEQSSSALAPQNNQNVLLDDPLSVGSGRQTTRRGVYFADPDDDSTDTLGYNRPPAGDAPVSSLVQQVFGGVKQDDSNNTGILSDEDDVDSIDAEADSSKMNLSPPPPPPAQDKSLSTLKQKLRGKQKVPVSRVRTTSKPNGSGPPKAKSAVPSRSQSKQNSGTLARPRDRSPPTGSSGMILPAVIEEKLFELEEEVKFYKSETLQLQKRKDYYDQEVKKLALERDEFARYQQEQRVLIEKEWERERAKMKKEEKLQERQWKLRMNATIAHQDRKDRGEVEMLKAQIVKMQLDEKARVSKWKAGNDNLRQRVAELEEKNRELSDEIKFLEKDRLEQWEKYERLLKERQEAPRSASKPENISAVSEKNELRTVDDLFAIKGTADELLQRWSFPHEDGLTQDCEEKNHTFEHHQRYVADEYNPQRYSLDREDPHPSSESVDFSDGNGFESANENGFASATSAAASYEWALPDAEDVYTTGCSSEADIAISASTSPLSEHRMVSQEIDHPGGKKELLFTDGSKKIIFADGNEKEIEANGHVVIKFTNGDHKEVFPDTGITVYYYHEAQTKLTTYADNRKVYEFPNQQIETSLPDGTTEIQFADGIKKTIRPNGDEFSVFPDGTTMLEQPDGLREVTLLNQKKIRYFPDGQMACVTPGGQETRVCSDSELKQLMAST